MLQVKPHPAVAVDDTAADLWVVSGLGKLLLAVERLSISSGQRLTRMD